MSYVGFAFCYLVVFVVTWTDGGDVCVCVCVYVYVCVRICECICVWVCTLLDNFSVLC